MALNQLEPWADRRLGLTTPLDRLFSDFDDFFGLRPSILESPAWMTRAERSVACTCDVQETDKAYLVSFDMPGVDKKDIDIDVSDNTLTVRGERHEEKETKGDGRTRFSERRYGSFQRSFTLPGDVSAEKVEASYDNGVLCVAIPKNAESKRQKIEIKEGGGLFSKLLPGQKGKTVAVKGS